MLWSNVFEVKYSSTFSISHSCCCLRWLLIKEGKQWWQVCLIIIKSSEGIFSSSWCLLLLKNRYPHLCHRLLLVYFSVISFFLSLSDQRHKEWEWRNGRKRRWSRLWLGIKIGFLSRLSSSTPLSITVCSFSCRCCMRKLDLQELSECWPDLYRQRVQRRKTKGKQEKHKERRKGDLYRKEESFWARTSNSTLNISLFLFSAYVGEFGLSDFSS